MIKINEVKILKVWNETDSKKESKDGKDRLFYKECFSKNVKVPVYENSNPNHVHNMGLATITLKDGIVSADLEIHDKFLTKLKQIIVNNKYLGVKINNFVGGRDDERYLHIKSCRFDGIFFTPARVISESKELSVKRIIIGDDK